MLQCMSITPGFLLKKGRTRDTAGTPIAKMMWMSFPSSPPPRSLGLCSPGKIVTGTFLPLQKVRSNLFSIICLDENKSEPPSTCSDRSKLFCFGLGYSGLALARTLQKQQWSIAGTCQSQAKGLNLMEHNIDAFVFHPEALVEGLGPDGVQALHSATHVLSTVPPSAGLDPVLMWHSEDIKVAASKALTWIGYLSTTSVYGDWDGQWVDESSEVQPIDAKGQSRVDAEKGWLRLGEACRVPAHVFRLGGIYGPGRSAIDTLKRGGTPSSSQKRRATQRYTARCHVEDICQVIEASMRARRGGSIYNIVDDDPAPRSDVMAFGRALLGLPALGTVDWDNTTLAIGQAVGGLGRQEEDITPLHGNSVSGSGSSQPSSQAPDATMAMDQPSRASKGQSWRSKVAEKRVSNRKIKEELGVKLRFSNYKEGLQAIVGESAES